MPRMRGSILHRPTGMEASVDTADRIFDEILACMAGDATPQECEVIDFLTYRTYRHNRELGATAAGLAKLWPQTGAAMERRYEAEINAYADSKIRADKEARHQGVSEDDLDVVGRALRAGT